MNVHPSARQHVIGKHEASCLPDLQVCPFTRTHNQQDVI